MGGLSVCKAGIARCGCFDVYREPEGAELRCRSSRGGKSTSDAGNPPLSIFACSLRIMEGTSDRICGASQQFANADDNSSLVTCTKTNKMTCAIPLSWDAG